MNTPRQEIQRLRGLVARAEAARDQAVADASGAREQLTELRGLVGQHLEATTEDPAAGLRREHAAFERGRTEGREVGWRQGVEHALAEVDRAHWRGDAHDRYGQMNELGLHNGPVPAPRTADQAVAIAEADGQLQADWWYREATKRDADAPRRGAERQVQREAS